VNNLWGEFNFNMALDHGVLITLEDEAMWALKPGLTGSNQLPDYLEFIFADCLDEVDPAAMCIIKWTDTSPSYKCLPSFAAAYQVSA
jgi:hypothetical protein